MTVHVHPEDGGADRRDRRLGKLRCATVLDEHTYSGSNRADGSEDGIEIGHSHLLD